MSAILAIVNKNGGDVAEHHFTSALTALRWRGRYRRVERLPHGWLGTVHPASGGEGFRGTDLAKDPFGNIAACHGHLYDLPGLYRRLDKPLPPNIHQRPAQAVLDACLKWGHDAPNHWSGEVSFVFWDQNNKELVVGRDHLGTRPLFFYDHGGLVAFCTDSKALLTIGSRIPEPDPVSMHRFLCLDSWQDERTFFLRVGRVLPAMLKVVAAGKLRSEVYWKPGQDTSLQSGKMDQHQDEFRERVQLAIDRRVESLASWTLDPRRDEFQFLLSSMLGHSESRNFEASAPTGSTGNDDSSRGLLVQRPAVTNLTGDELLDEMDRMNIFHDEPVASLPVISSWLLRNESSQIQAGVQLNQIGAKEFLGEDVHALSYLLKAGRLRELVRRAREAGITQNGLRQGLWGLLCYGLGPLLPSSLLNTRRSFLHKERFPWLNSTLTRLPLERQACLPGDFSSEVHHRLAVALRHGEMPLKLHYEDRHAGILGLETRYPFLDIDVVRFCFTLPADELFGPNSLGAGIKQASLQVVGNQGKPTLGRNLRDVLDGHWEEGEFQRRIAGSLSRSQLVADGWLRADKLTQLQDRVLSGRHDLQPQLWRVLTLEGWYRQRWSAQAKAFQPPALRIASRTNQQFG